MTIIGDEPEGAIPLDPNELDGLRHTHVTTRDELNQLEQANIGSGLDWLGRTRESEILTEAFMRKLHEKLFGDVWRWAGSYRTTLKNIGVDPSQIGERTRLLLDDAKYWSEHGTYSPLEAAARFHHQLVEIHCFPNGNGRHARIAADLYLKKYFSHPPIDWLGGEDLTTAGPRRKAYIAALRAADDLNYEPLLRFVGAMN
ncbi:MAG: mobile mystery protein B [Alphaproteobacteria bacterium]|nr:MAG: mobile mystery protein B [Alphaproteobacteria bacterium]